MATATAKIVSQSQVIVVEPFECAWIEGDYFIREGKGCISFQVKGDNDVTVIFKPQAGSRRWQHMAGAATPLSPNGRESPVERNYTVILGSHRNSCLKIEKDGDLCCKADNVPGSKLSATSFTKYWINYDAGCITVGINEVSPHNACFSWKDPEPIADIRFAGLSAWDKHVGYRNIQTHPAINFRHNTTCSLLAKNGGVFGASQSQQEEESSFGPSTLVETCCRSLLTSLNVYTVCDVLLLADALAPVIDGLRGHVVEYAAQHFKSILEVDSEGFAATSAESLGDILKSHSLDCEEKVVFDALLFWAGWKPCSLSTTRTQNTNNGNSSSGNGNTGGSNGIITHKRSHSNSAAATNMYALPRISSTTGLLLSTTTEASTTLQQQQDKERGLDQLLPLIRFPVMTQDDLAAVTQYNDILLHRSAVLRELLTEASEVHRQQAAAATATTPNTSSPSRTAATVKAQRRFKEMSAAEQLATARLQRRRPPNATELIYMFDGDTNGLCWYLGTGGGRREWMNPVVTGALTVKASSPNCRSTDPRGLVSRNFLRINFAGPKREGSGGKMTSWWMLDLGTDAKLECNNYTLRHDGSTDFLRNWALQGSNDGITWVDLRRHSNDHSLTKAGQYASWPVTTVARPHRYFRVLLTSPNSDSLNHSHVSLSFIELYGYLYKNEEKGDSSNGGSQAVA